MLAEPLSFSGSNCPQVTLGNSNLHRIMVVSLTNLNDTFRDVHVNQFRSMRHCGRREVGEREMSTGSFSEMILNPKNRCAWLGLSLFFSPKNDEEELMK